MLKMLVRRILALLLCCLLLPVHASPVMPDKAQLVEGFCERVVDGDTAWFAVVEDGIHVTHKVRFLNIDSPESVHPDLPVQYYADEASDYVTDALLDTTVWLEYDTRRLDRYGRQLCHIWLEDGTLFNLQLVELGYAKVLIIPPNRLYEDLFWEAQSRAIDQQLGMWGLPDTVAVGE